MPSIPASKIDIRTVLLRRIAILLLTTLILSCEQPDKSFSGDFLLENGAALVLPMKDTVSSPAFSSQEEFWTAKESEKRIFSRFNMDGDRSDKLTLYTTPPPDYIDNIDISIDGQYAYFTMNYNGLSTNVIGCLEFFSNDHDIFRLDGGMNYILTNPANVYCVDLDYNDGWELAYLGNYYDTGMGTVDQSLYVYEMGVGMSAAIPITWDLDYDSDMVPEGEAALCFDAKVDETTGQIDELAVALWDERDDEDVVIFKVYNTDGSETFDSTDIFEFENVGGMQWLGEESMVLCAKLDGRWMIVKGDSSGELETLYTAEKNVYALDGLDLSPDKDRCITRIVYDESGEENDILIVDYK